MKKVTWYDLSATEYEQNDRRSEAQNCEIFGDGYTIEDYYSDRGNVRLYGVADGQYFYEDEFENMRFVDIISEEEV